MATVTSTLTPRLRVPRQNLPLDSSHATSSADPGPSRLPEFSQLVDVRLSDVDLSDDTYYKPQSQATPRPPSKPSSSSSQSPANSLRALIARLPPTPPSPSASHHPSQRAASERDSDYDASDIATETPSNAQESLRSVFSHAMRDPGDTPQKQRTRSYSFTPSGDGPSANSSRFSLKGKGRQEPVSDEEGDNTRLLNRFESTSKTPSQPVTLEMLRERFSRSPSETSFDFKYPDSMQGHGSMRVVGDMSSMQMPHPVATSTPHQSLRMSVDSQSNLLDHDTEMHNAIHALDSFDPADSPPPRVRRRSISVSAEDEEPRFSHTSREASRRSRQDMSPIHSPETHSRRTIADSQPNSFPSPSSSPRRSPSQTPRAPVNWPVGQASFGSPSSPPQRSRSPFERPTTPKEPRSSFTRLERTPSFAEDSPIPPRMRPNRSPSPIEPSGVTSLTKSPSYRLSQRARSRSRSPFLEDDNSRSDLQQLGEPSRRLPPRAAGSPDASSDEDRRRTITPANYKAASSSHTRSEHWEQPPKGSSPKVESPTTSNSSRRGVSFTPQARNSDHMDVSGGRLDPTDDLRDTDLSSDDEPQPKQMSLSFEEPQIHSTPQRSPAGAPRPLDRSPMFGDLPDESLRDPETPSRKGRRPSYLPPRTPSPPANLPDLPSPSPSEDEKRRTPQSKHSRSKWMQTPRPPGAWANTPKPPGGWAQTPRPSHADDQLDVLNSHSPRTPVVKLEEASQDDWKPTYSAAPTPKPPGGWLNTPKAGPALDESSEAGPLRSGLLTPAGTGTKSMLSDFKTPAVPGGWKATPAPRKSILKVRFGPDTPAPAKYLSPPEDDFSLARTPSKPKSKASGIKVVDAFGQPEGKEPSQPPKEANTSKLRVVDAMGRELPSSPEPASPDSSDVASGPESRAELLARIRHGLDELAGELDDSSRDDDTAAITRVEELNAISRKARETRRRLAEGDAKVEKQVKKTPSLFGLVSATASRAWRIGLIVCLQLLVVFVMYRLSVIRAENLFLSVYFDPFNPELFNFRLGFSDTPSLMPPPPLQSWTALRSLKSLLWRFLLESFYLIPNAWSYFNQGTVEPLRTWTPT